MQLASRLLLGAARAEELIFHAAIISRDGAEGVILFETLCYLFLLSPGGRGRAWCATLAHRNVESVIVQQTSLSHQVEGWGHSTPDPVKGKGRLLVPLRHATMGGRA